MQDKLDQLFKRLDENLADLKGKWEAESKDSLIEISREITAVKDAHYYLTETHGFEPEEADYLLLFDNPLQIVADKWLDRTEDISDFSFALDEVFDKRDALRDYELQEKPSVLEKLRNAVSPAIKPGHPSKEQEVR
jgi:hypothetical protein